MERLNKQRGGGNFSRAWAISKSPEFKTRIHETLLDNIEVAEFKNLTNTIFASKSRQNFKFMIFC